LKKPSSRAVAVVTIKLINKGLHGWMNKEPLF